MLYAFPSVSPFLRVRATRATVKPPALELTRVDSGPRALQFVADGVFYAELNELLTRELAEDGYAGVEVRKTPMRTEVSGHGPPPAAGRPPAAPVPCFVEAWGRQGGTCMRVAVR